MKQAKLRVFIQLELTQFTDDEAPQEAVTNVDGALENQLVNESVLPSDHFQEFL